MNLAAQARFPRSAQMILLIAIILIAIVFRFAQFGQTPPGLHYDEAIDAKLAQDIRAGKWTIYFEEGWGREPLYHTLVALTLNFVSDPASALRLVSAMLGLAQLLAAYFLFRRLFGVPTALIAAAWIAVMFWTVSTSRAGLRNITLTTLATLTAWAFWQAWSATQGAGSGRPAQPPISFFTLHPSSFIPHPSAFLLPGILLGLTLYTYQPSRVVPIIYLVFIAYLSFTHRSSLTSNWKPLVVFLAIAVVVFVPLAIFLATHPGAETGRAFQTEPIRALLQGNPGPALHTAAATLKMFTFEGGGDPQPIYNVPGRPLFIGLGSILFYIGLLACLVRWRQPAYAFVLIWLIVTLLPNLLTEPAPFFYRAIAAQTPTLALPAIGTVALSDWVNRRGRDERKEKEQDNTRRSLRSSRFIVPVVVAAISLGQTAWTTQHDYFEVWGKSPEVRFQYSAAHTAIARALDASNDASPVAISGTFTEDADPYIFAQTLHRRDLSIRWFDARDTLVVSGAGGDQRIALPPFTPPDATLQSRFLRQSALISQTQDFVLFSFDASAFTADLERWGGIVQAPGLPASSLPVSFDGNLLFLGYEKPATISRAESTLTLLTAWRVTSEWQPSSTAIFAH
ncbi:MAG TPA: glycosyltransferase family 39 protein, partial [Anaerolineae bacterium]|nr:glycosyltransferase family 39 protein [Anaerolineae bacterium]